VDKYQPNFNHLRVRSRINLALAFIERTFKLKHSELYISKHQIDHKDNLGSSSNPLSQYLREVLLICTDNSYRFNSEQNKSKRYRANHLGVQYLREQLKETTAISWWHYRDLYKANAQYTHSNVVLLDEYQQEQADSAFDEYQEEIDSGQFVMKAKGYREYHRLQTIPRDIRTKKFAQAGYCHDYDIEAAAPTLLLQRARLMGHTTATPAIDAFLNNKVEIRQYLADTAHIEYSQAKQTITALFQGGILSTHSTNKIFTTILHFNGSAISALQQCEYVELLKKEISDIWRTLSRDIERQTIVDRNGNTRKKRITGKQKAAIYGETEQEIIKSVKRYIKKKEKSIRVMFEHDGWRCDRIIDRDDLISHVRRTTGYLIKIDYSKIEVFI
jgi:hypothetical protein